MNEPDLVIFICSHRALSVPTVHSLENLRLNPLVNYIVHIASGDALLSRSRSRVCTDFLEKFHSPFMLFIDDDIIFTPKDIKKLYDWQVNGYDVIGGLYSVSQGTQFASYGWGGKLTVDNQVQEIEYLATGFMGISRRILAKIKDELKLPILNPNDWSRCYPFFQAGQQLERSRGGDPIYISEDWFFCDLVRKVGGKVYVDTAIQLGHWRERAYHIRDVLEYQQREAMEAKLFGSMRRQQELILSIDTDLSEYLKITVGETQKEMTLAQKKLVSEWQAREGSVVSFYEQNRTYLFDLAAFNRYLPYYQDRLSPLCNLRDLKILDIGCGLGTTVFMMAGQNNETTGWDVNRLCIDFCLFKQKKYELGGLFTVEPPELKDFDVVTAIDTLEHIEDLQGFLKWLGQGMKRGSKLYHSDYFPKDDTWPMHFEEHQAHLDDWLNEAGFVILDRTWAVKS